MAMTPAGRFAASREFWGGRRVLVTGHTGFKGGWLALWLSSLGASVAGLSLEPESSPNLFDALGLAGLVSHRLGDIRDQGTVSEAIESEQPQIVFHLAAQSLVRRSYRDPGGTIATNVLGTTHVLEACRRSSSVQVALIVTSDKVYENRERREAYREEEQLGGHDLYSVSKACAELVTSGYRRAFPAPAGRPYAIATARAGNVIGGGDWGEDRIIPDLARAFSRGEIADVRAPDALRPWQHVLDVTRGYLAYARALVEAPRECPTSLNFGPREASVTVGELANVFAIRWGEGRRWRHKPDATAPHEASLLAIDSGLAARFLGWTAKVAVTTALAITADWYRLQAQGANAETLRRLSLDQIASSTG